MTLPKLSVLVRDVLIIALIPMIVLPLPVVEAFTSDNPHCRIPDLAVSGHVVLDNPCRRQGWRRCRVPLQQRVLALDRFGMKSHTQVVKQFMHALANDLPDDLECCPNR